MGHPLPQIRNPAEGSEWRRARRPWGPSPPRGWGGGVGRVLAGQEGQKRGARTPGGQASGARQSRFKVGRVQ